MTSVLWRGLVAYGVGFIVIFGLLSLAEHRQQQAYSALVSRGVHVKGAVTSYSPENHQELAYAFTVDGRAYHGSNPAEGTFTGGQAVDVTYDRKDPNNNCVCNARSELDNANGTPIVGGLWLGLAVLGWYLAQHYYRLRAPARPSSNPLPVSASNLIDTSSVVAGGQVRSYAPPSFPQWLWTSWIVRYSLRIPAQEAAERLSAAVRRDTLLRALSPVVGLVGWVREGQFQITTRVPFMANSFDSVLDGRIVSMPEGSMLLGTFHPRKITLVFMAIWIILALFICVPAAIATVMTGGWQPGPIFFLVLFPLFGIALLAFGRLLAHWQEQRLLRQLDDLFDVR